MDTQEMLFAIIKVAEAHGQYDGYDQYMELIKKREVK